MDPLSAYIASQVTEVAKSAARRWLPALILLAFVAPLFAIVMVSSTVSTITDDESPTGDVDCSGGGAIPAGAVKATWNGRPYEADQIANAQTIVGVGRQTAVPPRGWLVAITAAMQESTLRNLNYGDRDSVGLFQMRPSMGWGTPEQLTDPHYAANKFYEVLQEVPGWESMSINDAAQAVERSGFPDAYGKHEAAARALIADPVILGASCGPAGGVGGPVQQRVVAAALSQLGVPYSWGGGDWHGPTRGIDHGAGTVGFDCSGLVGYAWYQGSGHAVAMDTWTGSELAASNPVDRKDIQAGDMLFFGGSPAAPDHVGLYDGKGGMIHAPRTGTVIQVQPDILHNSYWMGRLIWIGRPKAFIWMPQAPAPAPSPSAPITAAMDAPRPRQGAR